ncbi:MAG: type II toxin-antitoxin system PemK/MazF family toxin [Acidimicrobiia bacterium]
MASDRPRRTAWLRGAVAAAKRTAQRVARRVAGRRRRRTPRPSDGAVHVEYSPRLDGDPDPGEVVWTWVPYEEDATQGKDRPVVVIGRRNGRLVAVPLTSKPDDREAQISVGTGGWDSQRRESYARVWRMFEVDPARMRREGAILDRDRFAAVVALVDQYHAVRLPD